MPRRSRPTSIPRFRHANADDLAEQVRDVLSPDLLKPEYRRLAVGKPASFGHCYAAAEALFHMLGGKAAGWTPQSIRHEGVPHWFLRHRSGRVLDQFATPVPHENAVGKGFLTRAPSKRAREIMRRVMRVAKGWPETVTLRVNRHESTSRECRSRRALGAGGRSPDRR